MKIRVYIILVFLSISSIGFCNSDSLSLFIDGTKDVDAKFESINKLVAIELNSSPDKAMKYALVQLNTVKVDSQLARAYLNIGLAFDYQSKFDSAIFNYNKSLSINKVIKNEYWQAKALLNLGIVNYYKGDLEKSVGHYLDALKIFEKLDDDVQKSVIYNNLGSLYRSKNQYKKALKFIKKSLVIDQGNKDSVGMSGAYNNIGIAFRNLNMLDSALFYYEKSLELKRIFNDQSGIASTLTNMGQLYYHQKDFDLGLKYNLEALAIERGRDNKRGICQSYINIGEGYLHTEDLNSALFYLERGHAMALDHATLEDLISSLEGLAEAHSQNGNYKEAYEYYQQFSHYKDSMLNKESNQQIAELDAIYENDTKQKEIILLNKEKVLQQADYENQRLQKIVMAVLLSSVLFILIFIIRGFREKKRANSLLEHQKNIVEEKNREITDSINYAQRIQKAVLKSEDAEALGHLDHFILFKPKDIVSGDFYWFIEKGDFIYLTAADCTGHGVPGGFMSMLGIAFLNEINANSELLSPAHILDKLRGKIIKELGQKGKLGENKDGLDISLIKIDKSKQSFEWAGANNPLWIITSNDALVNYASDPIKIDDSDLSFCEIKPNKEPIGYSSIQNPFTNHKIDLNQGDMIYLFTDGYADQFGGEKAKKFMKKRFKKLLIQNANDSMEAQKNQLDVAFNNWKGDLEQLDDVCIIGVKI